MNVESWTDSWIIRDAWRIGDATVLAYEDDLIKTALQ